MESSVKKVLFVNSEMLPYLPESEMSRTSRELAPGIQDRKKEIRSFMPRYGCINERKYQLHEVIRLSGMNIIIDDVDRPLIIKVASIPSARIQVYFIDNEDYFSRKQLYCSEEGKTFPDNDERAIFFARGVLETVKKLRWAPDVIHCQGWITHLLPLYLKKVYKDDPIFAGSKVVLSLYDEPEAGPFCPDFASKVATGSISTGDVPFLKDAGGMELAKTAAQYSDGLIIGSQSIDPSLESFCKGLGIPLLPFDAEAAQNGKYIDGYSDFYDRL